MCYYWLLWLNEFNICKNIIWWISFKVFIGYMLPVSWSLYYNINFNIHTFSKLQCIVMFNTFSNTRAKNQGFSPYPVIHRMQHISMLHTFLSTFCNTTIQSKSNKSSTKHLFFITLFLHFLSLWPQQLCQFNALLCFHSLFYVVVQ